MKQQEALLLKKRVERDRRIQARIRGAGRGVRLHLVLHEGTVSERSLEAGHKQDVEQIIVLWKGL